MFLRLLAFISILMTFIGCDMLVAPVASYIVVAIVITLAVASLLIPEIAETIQRSRQVDQQIKQLADEVQGWQDRRNQQYATVKWRFTNEDARLKLKTLYPPVWTGWATRSIPIRCHGVRPGWL